MLLLVFQGEVMPNYKFKIIQIIVAFISIGCTSLDHNSNGTLRSTNSNMTTKYADLTFIVAESNESLTISGSDIMSILIKKDNQMGSIVINVKLNSEGSKSLAKLTTQNVLKKIMLVVKNENFSVFTLMEPIPDGILQFTYGDNASTIDGLAEKFKSD
jgi:preprotein translocase subunit SecD